MKYLPLTEKEKVELLRELDKSSIEELFGSIPQEIQKKCSQSLPPPRSEIELRKFFNSRVTSREANVDTSFLGGNGHTHYIPSVIDPLISRGEFLTAYTPYQPEISQGTLQAVFEYQSMMASLMGVDISNASLYDGSTAMAEACLMAARIAKKDHILVSSGVHPEYLETLKTYSAGGVFQFSLIGEDERGRLKLEGLSDEMLTHEKDLAAVVIQSPNRHGIIESIKNINDFIKDRDVLLIVVVTEALSLPLLKSPGEQGADIVCGEAQSFGIPLSFGGPWLGFIGCNTRHMRNLPGRLVGKSVDQDGRDAYVITLAAREQHIRREKATSNICTNQGLMALRCAIYLSVMGKQGTRRAAERSARFTAYARELVKKAKNIKLAYTDSPVFNEFEIDLPVSARHVTTRCIDRKGIAPGTITDENRLLVSFNETMSVDDVEQWVNMVDAAAER